MLAYLRANPQWLVFLLFLIAGRLLLSHLIPLMDTTEARYGEIGRKMWLLQDWVTPWFKDGEPFWGKPPLLFWSVATSFGLFGVTEFAARLPSLIVTLATGVVIYRFVARLFDAQTAFGVVAIYLSTWVITYSSGAVITDTFLVFATTLVMTSFWEALHDGPKRAAYLLWIALGVGLLAKGPIGLVIAGLACGFWVLIRSEWVRWFKRVRLVAGLVLMHAVAAPWYFIAEQKTPGFLNYFLIGEHFYRFVEPAWEGDPYGEVKDQVKGAIWAYYFVALLPWTPFILLQFAIRTGRSKVATVYRNDPSLATYLLCWSLAPVVFFTLASNILLTYVMPAVPAVSILMMLTIRQWSGLTKRLSVVCISLTLVFFVSVWSYFEMSAKYSIENHKPIVAKYQELNELDPGSLTYAGDIYRFSVAFYTQDKTSFLRNTFSNYGDETAYFVFWKLWQHTAVENLSGRCTVELEHGEFYLWYCPGVGSE